jgi:hypothetical protein
MFHSRVFSNFGRRVVILAKQPNSRLHQNIIQPAVHFKLQPVISARLFSSNRAGKGIKPGEAIVVDGAPHKVKKITQGKRGKGGGYVR